MSVQHLFNRTTRRGFTILELLVTMSLLSLLAALLLPALIAGREAARRVECSNHLRQIGLALHNYHDSFNSFTAAWQFERSKRSALGWAVPLLPHLEQNPLYETMERGRCLGDSRMAPARATHLPVFSCPSDVAPPFFSAVHAVSHVELMTLPSANYVGIFGTFEPDDFRPTVIGNGTFADSRPVRMSELTRGLSNTLIVGERSISSFHSTWIGFDHRDEDGECRIVASAVDGPNCSGCDECELGSRHAGVSLFLFADGHVAGLSNSIDPIEYRQLARRSD